MSLIDRLAKDKSLTASAFQVLCALLSTPETQAGTHTPSLKDLTQITGRTKATVHAALTLLTERGYVVMTPVQEPGRYQVKRHYQILTSQEP